MSLTMRPDGCTQTRRTSNERNGRSASFNLESSPFHPCCNESPYTISNGIPEEQEDDDHYMTYPGALAPTLHCSVQPSAPSIQYSFSVPYVNACPYRETHHMHPSSMPDVPSQLGPVFETCGVSYSMHHNPMTKFPSSMEARPDVRTVFDNFYGQPPPIFDSDESDLKHQSTETASEYLSRSPMENFEEKKPLCTEVNNTLRDSNDSEDKVVVIVDKDESKSWKDNEFGAVRSVALHYWRLLALIIGLMIGTVVVLALILPP